MSGLTDRIRAAGIDIKLEGSRLLIRGTMTDEQRSWIARHKSRVIADLGLEGASRPMVEYQFDRESTWYTLLGRPGESLEDACAALLRQFPDVTATRERASLPAGFPLKRHGDDGEYKTEEGEEL